MKATNIIAARMDRTTKMVPRTLCLAISRPQRQPITISTAQARGKLQGGLSNIRRSVHRPRSSQPARAGRADRNRWSAQQTSAQHPISAWIAQKKSRRRAPMDNPRFRLLVHRAKAYRNRHNRIMTGNMA